MASWTDRDSTHLGADVIFTSPTAQALYDNAIAIAEGAAGAPSILDSAPEEIARSGLPPLLQATASSDTSIDFTSKIDTTYQVYVFIISKLVMAADLRTLAIRTSTDGGSTFDNASYRYSAHSINGTDFSGSKQQIEVVENGDIGNGAGEHLNGIFVLHDPASSSSKSHWHFDVSWQNGANTLKRAVGIGHRNVAESIDAVRFFANGQTIQGGEFRMYGVKKS